MIKKTVFLSLAVAATALAAYGFRGGATSGLQPGDPTPAFDPTHVSGPDAGTKTCPVCKYGARPAVQVWLAPDESTENAAKFTEALGKAMSAHKDKDMKGFVVMMTMCQGCVAKAEKFGKEMAVKNVGVTYVATTDPAVKGYKINTSKDVKNTVMVYKDRKIVSTFVNLTPDKEGLAKLNAAIESVTK